MSSSSAYYSYRGRDEYRGYNRRSNVSDLYGNRSESRLDFSSYHRAATPPPDRRRGAYAPSPPRDSYNYGSRYGGQTQQYSAPHTSSYSNSSYHGSVPRNRSQYPAQAVGSLIPGHGDDGRYSIVFDLDETLCYARAGPARARPGLQQVLNVVRDEEVIVWTAGEQAYADQALRSLGAAPVVRHVIARDGRWWREGGTKELSRLGRQLSRTLIIENTAQCIESNPDCAVLVPDFTGSGHDSALSALSEVLQRLVRSGDTVQNFLQTCPLLTVRRVRANATGRVFDAYSLRDHVPNDCVDGGAAPQAASYSYGNGYGVYGGASQYSRYAQPYSHHKYVAAFGSAYNQTA